MADEMLEQFIVDLFCDETIKMMKEDGLQINHIKELSVHEQYRIIQEYLDHSYEENEFYNKFRSDEREGYRDVDFGYREDDDYSEY